MAHTLTWRNPGTATGALNPGVRNWGSDPHTCHLSVGFSGTECSTCTIKVPDNMGHPTALDTLRGITRMVPTIWQDAFGMMRVFGVIFIPVWYGFDTRYIAYNTLLGHAKLIKHTSSSANNYIRFEDSDANGCYDITMIPSSGLAGDSDQLWVPGIRIYNNDVDDAVEVKFTATSSDVEFAGVLIVGSAIITTLTDGIGNVLETEVQSLGSFADLDAFVHVATGWATEQSTAYGTWSSNLTGTGTIASTDITPTADFLYCLEAFADLTEDSLRTATVAITESAGDKTLTLRYDAGGGGGIVTTNIDLTAAAYDTLGELESYIEGLGQEWVVQVESAAGDTSNDLAETTQVDVLSSGRQALIAIEADGFFTHTTIQPTDQLRVVDTNSLANGRTYVIGDSIDLKNGYAEVLGGPPADKVLFGPSASSISVRVVRQSGQWIDMGDVTVWRSNNPNVGATPLSPQYAQTCKHWRRTDFNVRYTGSATDDWTHNELEEDYSNYRSAYGCTSVNDSNTVPGSAQDTLANYNLGADGASGKAGYVATGYVKLWTGSASAMVEVKGCSGGPSGSRCPYYESQTAADYNLDDFFSNLMYGEWWTYIQKSIGEPYYEIEWRSPYSLAALVGTFPNNNRLLNTRRYINRVSGGIGAREHADFAEDGSYFKLFSVSNDDEDTTVEGQCENLLGGARSIPRYAASSMSSAHVGTNIIDNWNLVWDTNFLSAKSIDDRGNTAS